MIDSDRLGDDSTSIDETEAEQECSPDPAYAGYSGYTQVDVRAQALNAALHPSMGFDGRGIGQVLADAAMILNFLNGDATNG